MTSEFSLSSHIRREAEHEEQKMAYAMQVDRLQKHVKELELIIEYIDKQGSVSIINAHANNADTPSQIPRAYLIGVRKIIPRKKTK